MSSDTMLLGQKTSGEGSLRYEVVNTPGAVEAPSRNLARNDSDIFQRLDVCLIERIVEKGNVKRALRRVEVNKGAPGIDGMRVDELKEYLKKNWGCIRDQLLNGTYQPMSVRRVEIPKPCGGKRKLGIPSVLDRFIQQAILQILNPFYDVQFSENSFGFRPKRGAAQAIKVAQSFIKDGNATVVDVDLEKFFDKVNHDKLIGKLSEGIKDKRLLLLIRRFLNAGVMLHGCCVRSEEGTPQGGPLSPLLSNIVLHELDLELERRGHRFVRYADDCNIYVKSERAGKRVMESIRRFIELKLKLKVNQQKSAVDKPWRRTFLSFSFISDDEKRVRIPEEVLKRFKKIVRRLTARSWSISIEERIKRLRRYMIGWFNYFRIAQTPSTFKRLDGWVRRRLRACLLKQWKRPQTVKRNLVNLGLSRSRATRIAYSRKGLWRLALTQQVHSALGNKFWEDLGFISFEKRYREFVKV